MSSGSRRTGRLSWILFCLGSAVAMAAPAAAQTQDILGVYFDTAGTTNAVTTTAPYQVVTAYLVLLNPSAAAGIAAWECECDVVGAGLLNGSWALNGMALNVQTPPKFNVGIGTEHALPWSPAVLLATHTAVVTAPGAEIEYYLHGDDIGSLQDPPYSGNNVPCYADGADASVLHRLYVPGCENRPVATINSDGNVVMAMPTTDAGPFDFGTHLERDHPLTTFTIRNLAALPISGLLQTGDPNCQVWFGTATPSAELPTYLPPHTTRTMYIGYDCQTPGDFAGHLKFLACDQVAFNVSWWIHVTPLAPVVSPAAIDFGLVPPGQSVAQGFAITNYSSQVYTDTLRFDGSPTFAFVRGRAEIPLSLPPMGVLADSIAFSPTVYRADAAGCLRMRGACGVTLSGASTTLLVVSPTVLEFGDVHQGQYRDLPATLESNWHGQRLTGTVQRQAGPFSVVQGSGSYYNYNVVTSQSLTVHYSPAVVGEFTDTLRISGAFHDLVCHGTCSARPPACVVYGIDYETWSLDFGTVMLGHSAVRNLTIENCGGQTLTGSVVQVAAPFHIDAGTGDYALGPGASWPVTVSYTPVAAQADSARLDLGTHCGDLVCKGAGAAVVPTQDVIGIYFNPTGTATEYYVTSPDGDEVVTAYLILKNPSDSSGIYRWETCASILQAGYPLTASWSLSGGANNYATAPCFNAQLPGPLTGTPSVVLATLQVTPAVTGDDVSLYLAPLANPSLPGTVSYVTWGQPNSHIPLVVSSGSFSLPVARIHTYGSPLGVAAQAPAVARTASGIALTWSAGESGADAAHVYRRVGSDPAARLSALPLPVNQGRVDYLDAAGDVARGSVLRYSLGLVRDDQEFGRTPETAITLTAIVPATTALHPAYPNPFNPETTIAFDLARAGQTRLEVFDASGRRIRTLADENLAAGSYTRAWDGRDATGRPVPSGVYYCRLSTDGVTSLRKLMLLR